MDDISQPHWLSYLTEIPNSIPKNAGFGFEENVQASVKLIIGRLECGRTQLEVSEELGIDQSVISRLWQRFQDDGNVNRCYSTGRPRVTTPNEDQYLAKRNRQSKASDLSRQLSSATGTTVSRQTVYRRLGHIGLYARRPVRCVPITATHCHLRLTWSREHALGTSQQWSCVMFSGESRFSLQSDSSRTLKWRAPGTRYHQENAIERHRYGCAGWLVWGGIILGSRTDVHIQNITMTVHIYRDVILEQHVRLFRGAMGAEFLFMDDHARPHRANIVYKCLQSEDIARMDWPAYSPDLNPIEHVWNMLGRRIAARQTPPTCLPELRRALFDVWCNIPQDQIYNLILSIPSGIIPWMIQPKERPSSAEALAQTQWVHVLKRSTMLHLQENIGPRHIEPYASVFFTLRVVFRGIVPWMIQPKERPSLC
ncbi:transposable element Tcb2 transposase [Trichonephila clavipes]|uniref:Transposable element Tcb2 transposase n=1 Tax=Trichonephila clavipes TaxID=2585209 RepID=A0A8X6VZB5_TRICX|nr:transposable element Tcb2 transposase [Trichonephila clavipes]